VADSPPPQGLADAPIFVAQRILAKNIKMISKTGAKKNFAPFSFN